MASITPFKIAITGDRIQRLKQKLLLSDFPNEIIDAENPWAQGAPLSHIKRLASYWQKGFDWRNAESELNKFPQYLVDITVENFGVYNIHFLHQPSTIINAIPLLFLHGWPGSFIEVTKMVSGLIKGENGPSFHVVAPSLVDFGFSSGSKQKSFRIDQQAEVCHKLMLSLGYDQYIVQGGDIGSIVARLIALNYGPLHCKAHHLNNTAPAEPTAESHPSLHAKIKNTPLTPSERAGLIRTRDFYTHGDGYFKLLTTKPLTISYSLTDSPIGLLAFIYEKLHDWADHYPWSDDEILTWVSIYYFSTAGPGASGNVYYEMGHREPGAFTAAQEYTNVPLGVSRFNKELVLLPKAWNETMGKVVFESEHEDGGHFPAWERPDAIVGDLRRMFGKGGGAFGCIDGKNGYDD